MTMLLKFGEEDELHKARLLNVEEKPFKRITKRLLAPGSLLNNPLKLPTPPPETGSAEDTSEDDPTLKQQAEERQQLRQEIIFDFDAFDSSIARIQFLRNSNENERDRYTADKQRILDTMQEVRVSTAQLRIQLEESKKTLEQRKKFDELAEKITGNRLLRPREDQEVNLRKLEEECRELEKESLTYGETWKERREQFGKIVEEGMQLRRLIRDEKEEVERREGMDGGEEDGEVGEGSRGGQTPKHSSFSGNATPRPDGESQSMSGSGLKPRPLNSGTFSRPGSTTGSRAASPAGSEREREELVEGEDSMILDDGPKVEESDIVAATPLADTVDMAIVSTPQVVVDEPSPMVAVEGVEPSEEEGEEGEAEDKMDTT
ncbi:uncharacterized protein LY89DRAFT_683567 [Mollisia scopiformis]|uniref:Tho complex subunit 7 n=1 Tax=Mollisia scopiformis TaxID=149040 RepID=A0A194XET2_MOLSC|nr:uncharacterized protein LY89DRAFT_683567 [Mollisia scopiformis]KUJ18656.1 hypothetical protein LY89DRAFT_683567 [Mollisia scopiformis]